MRGFTEDQIKNIKALNRKYALKAFGMIAKCFGLLLLANFLVCFADIAYVHSKVFVFLASFLSGFLFSKLLIDNFRFLGDNLKAETIKVIQEKGLGDVTNLPS